MTVRSSEGFKESAALWGQCRCRDVYTYIVYLYMHIQFVLCILMHYFQQDACVVIVNTCGAHWQMTVGRCAYASKKIPRGVSAYEPQIRGR